MRLNKFEVSAVLYFKSGTSKKIDWIEEKLVKKVEQPDKEIIEPLTEEEADTFFQAKFKEWKDKGVTVVRKNIKGENSVIPFSEVEYLTFTVRLLDDNQSTETNNDELDGIKVKDIKDHPAYKQPK
jgi:hypothetical protein